MLACKYSRPISMAQVILLNGSSSAGKTTLALKLQQLLPRPYQYLGLDQFRDGMPERVRGLNAPEGTEGSLGLNVVPLPSGLTEIQFGEFGDQVLRGMRMSAAAFAANDIPVIIDDLLLKEAHFMDYVELFDPLSTWVVGVRCDQATVNEREAARPGRFPGTAIEHFDKVHAAIDAYDVEVDTSNQTPRESAETVIERLTQPPECLARHRAHQT